jgi:hypothetical protein
MINMTVIMPVIMMILIIQLNSLYIHMLTHYEVNTSKRRKNHTQKQKTKDKRNQLIFFRQYLMFN